MTTEEKLRKAENLLARMIAWFNADLTTEDVFDKNGVCFAKEALDLNSIVNDAEVFLKENDNDFHSET